MQHAQRSEEQANRGNHVREPNRVGMLTICNEPVGRPIVTMVLNVSSSSKSLFTVSLAARIGKISAFTADAPLAGLRNDFTSASSRLPSEKRSAAQALDGMSSGVATSNGAANIHNR